MTGFPLTLSPVSVGTSPVACVPANESRQITTLIFQAPLTNTAPIFIGGSNVTTSNGIAIAVGESMAVSCDYQMLRLAASSFFAVSSASGQSLKILAIFREV
jgi:hypothetical protein